MQFDYSTKQKIYGCLSTSRSLSTRVVILRSNDRQNIKFFYTFQRLSERGSKVQVITPGNGNLTDYNSRFLIDSGFINGVKMASSAKLMADIVQAGNICIDDSIAIGQQLITSPQHRELPYQIPLIIKELNSKVCVYHNTCADVNDDCNP